MQPSPAPNREAPVHNCNFYLKEWNRLKTVGGPLSQGGTTHNRTGSPRKLQSLLGSANPWSQSSNPKTEVSGSCYTQDPAVAPAEKRCHALLLGTYKPEPGPWGLCHSHRKQDPSSAQFPWIKSGHAKPLPSVPPARPHRLQLIGQASIPCSPLSPRNPWKCNFTCQEEDRTDEECETTILIKEGRVARKEGRK